jgi:hypothetical protein
LHADDPRAKELFAQGKFEIVRKPPDLMLVLRRLVHDQNHAAKETPPRWTPEPGSAWRTDAAGGFQIKSEGPASHWLRYRHLRPERAGEKVRPSLITDFHTYNTQTLEGFDFERPENWVGDLMVECDVKSSAAHGELWLELSRGADRIQARLNLKSNEITLIRSGAQKGELARKPAPFNLTGKHRLRFANFDRRATLWLDDALPFGDGIPYEPAPQPGPTAADLEPVRIGAVGAGVRVHRLKIWSDFYWNQRPGQADHTEPVNWSDPTTWPPQRAVPPIFAFIQPGHYFMVGDNPMFSADSRDWGLVPAPAMRGHMVLRYWPPLRVGWLR